MELTRTSLPRVLLVEDDPISREVLTRALHGLPVEVQAVASLASARDALATCTFDTWLVDAHLPDGDGRELLGLRPAHTVALAHTASTDVRVLDGLTEAGFVEVLCKPLAAADVQAVVQRALLMNHAGSPTDSEMPPSAKQPVWDNAMALRALAGNADHVRALRGLFIGELKAELEGLAQARADGNAVAMRARVHRLRASCGFVGAARVAAQLQRLELTPLDAAAFEAMSHAGRDTLLTPDPFLISS